ncbi:HpcH/HpaI aldolase/citrate lyase family protein [uncultured Jatrophihabitans sp.]|uniref:HpcH/HpaI aldolase/citrate lyase family protein n=1 Tax=uncultured Jatrophihabitans sp. TaxID=1610747 RepID=UPI0035CC9191
MTRHSVANRSLLFVPGTRPDRVSKALISGAHLVVVDLEDAVAPADKDAARNRVAALADLPELVVRVNGVHTEWYAADLAALRDAARPPRAVLLPKADAGSVELAGADLPATVEVLALVESAQGMREVYDVAEHPRVRQLVFGSIDYALDLGIMVNGPAEHELLPARSSLVLASRTAGIAAPIDGVTTELDDLGVTERDARRARALGFAGKLAIHPAQVPAIHAGFRPGDAEIADARAVVAAAQDGSAARAGSRMVDAPVLDRARRLLAEVEGG